MLEVHATPSAFHPGGTAAPAALALSRLRRRRDGAVDAVPDDAVPDGAVPDGAVPDGAVPDEAGPAGAARLRAAAHAAHRSAQASGPRALDVALGVMETEIARLRRAVDTYGETLKWLQVYAADDAARDAARSALLAAPERLPRPAPAPKLPLGGAAAPDEDAGRV